MVSPLLPAEVNRMPPCEERSCHSAFRNSEHSLATFTQVATAVSPAEMMQCGRAVGGSGPCPKDSGCLRSDSVAFAPTV